MTVSIFKYFQRLPITCQKKSQLPNMIHEPQLSRYIYISTLHPVIPTVITASHKLPWERLGHLPLCFPMLRLSPSLFLSNSNLSAISHEYHSTAFNFAQPIICLSNAIHRQPPALSLYPYYGIYFLISV
jgi:hypothetical protein